MNISNDVRREELMKAIWDAQADSDTVLGRKLSEESVQEFPDSAEFLAINSYYLLWNGRRDEAIAAARKAKELGPDCALAWGAEAQLAGFEGRKEDSLAYAEKALSLDDNGPWVIQWCKDAYAFAGQTDLALALSRRYYESHPDEVDAFSQYITWLSLACRMEEAESLLCLAEQKFPGAHLILHKRARVYLRSLQLTNAIELLEQGLQTAPNSSTILGELALALVHSHRDDEAETAARRALSICPVTMIAMNVLAKVCEHRGKKREAADWRRKSAEAIPGLYFTSLLSQATIAMKKQDWNTVLTITDKFPSSATPSLRSVAWSHRIRAFLALRRIDEAEEAIEQLERLNANGRSVYQFRGELQLANGRTDEAIIVLKLGVERYSTDGVLRAQLLRVLNKQGDVEAENALVQDLISKMPDMPSGIVAAYMALDDTKHPLMARELLNRGIERFPGAPEFSVFDAVDKFAKGDLVGAKNGVAGVIGEWRPVADMVENGVEWVKAWRSPANISKMKWLLGLVGVRLKERPGDGPETLN